MLDHLGRAIFAAGYQVLTAPDSVTALATMQKEFAPIVISDVNLPDMDGLSLCRTIRRQSYPGYTYLMLYSAKDGEATFSQAWRPVRTTTSANALQELSSSAACAPHNVSCLSSIRSRHCWKAGSRRPERTI